MLGTSNLKRPDSHNLPLNEEFICIEQQENTIEDEGDQDLSRDNSRNVSPGRIWKVNRRLQFKHGRLIATNPRDIEDIKLAKQ